MDRQEQDRVIASLTDDELKQLRAYTRNLFGRDERDPDEIERQRLATPKTDPRGNIVAREGSNPGGAPISAEARMRDFVRRMFDADYAAYEQPLPEPEQET